ncbi:MAG: four helix bundle protein [Chloroflexi bacterium]|nr:four helix bundle protein [Chloroflexota bacterium]
MTTVERFEDTPVWQQAREIVRAVYQMTKDFPSNEKLGLTMQIQGSAVYTMSSIAEGFECSTVQECINFLHIAKSSNGRVRSYAYVALDLWYILQGECDNLIRHCETLSKHLNESIEQLEHTINDAE